MRLRTNCPKFVRRRTSGRINGGKEQIICARKPSLRSHGVLKRDLSVLEHNFVTLESCLAELEGEKVWRVGRKVGLVYRLSQYLSAKFLRRE